MSSKMKMKYIESTAVSILTVLSIVSPVQAQFGDRTPFFRDGYNQMQQEIQRLQSQPQNPELPSQLLTVDDGKLHWQKFIFRDANFSVWMPEGIQSEQEHNLETTIGELPFDIVATHPLTWQFIAAYSKQLDSSQLDNPEILFTSIRDGIVQETQFQLVEEKPISLDQYSGQQITLQNNNQTFTFRVYLANQRVYILAVRKTNNRASSENVTNFFDSFRILQ